MLYWVQEVKAVTIAEVARTYDLSPDTLRYYERIGLIPPVNRAPSGNRDYTPGDCRWVEFAKCMRGAGLQIEALIDYVALFQQGDGTKEARKGILVEQRAQLAGRMEAMRKTMDRLDDKIQRYEQTVANAEKGLNMP